MASRPQKKKRLEIHRTAEKMAEERMKQIMAELDKKKPTFQDVETLFESVFKVAKEAEEKADPDLTNLVDLARIGLKEYIREGIRD